MKFHTAPMRLKRGSGLSDLQAEMSGEISPDPKAAFRTYSISSLHEDSLATDLAEMSGSWPKVSKRRTSSINTDTTMSLREVSEALAAANITAAPAAANANAALDDAFGLDGLAALDALDALVTAELEDEAAATAADDDACAERFVDAVFGDQHAPVDPTPPPRRLSEADEEALFALCLPAQGMGTLGDAPVTELDGDELLAMLHEPLEALQQPASDSDSPTSVETNLFPSTPLYNAPRDATVSQKLQATMEAEHAKATSRNGAERKEWTSEEDEIIRNSVLQHGCRWRRIAAQLPGRSDDAVRNRWNRLKVDKSEQGATAAEGASAGGATGAPPPAPAKRTCSADGPSKPERVSWTRAEDETILQSVQELGHKWNKLAERLPGRTDHAIRNRFHRLQTMMEDKQREQPQPRSIEQQPVDARQAAAADFFRSSLLLGSSGLESSQLIEPSLALAPYLSQRAVSC